MMTLWNRGSLHLLVWLGLVAAHSAQGRVWVVDDQAGAGVDFTSVQLAIDTASDGDILLIKPGRYGQMSLVGKGLTLQGDTGGLAVLSGFSHSIRSVPSGSSVQLRNLALESQQGVFLGTNEGTIWLEECTLSPTSHNDNPGLTVHACPDVVLIACLVLGSPGPVCSYDGYPGDGLEVRANSSVHAYGSRFVGGQGGSCDGLLCGGTSCTGFSGGKGAVSSGSQLFCSACEVVGGDAGECWASGGGPDGGTGLSLEGGGHANLLDSVLTGGRPASGGWSPCAGSSPGAAFLGTPTLLPGASLSVSTVMPVRENGVVSVHIEGPPLVPVWRGRAPRARSFPALQILRGVVLPELATTLPVEWVGITNGAGVLDVDFPVGALPAGFDSGLEFWQFYYLETPRLPGGWSVLQHPRVPKTFVLGSGTMVLTLDDSF